MSNETMQMIVWVFLIVVIMFAFTWFISYSRKSNKKKRADLEKMQAFKEAYEFLTPEKIENLPDDQLASAVIMQCQRKEDNDIDYFKTLNEVEKTVYGIYQINQSLTASTGLRSFFASPACADFVPVIDTLVEKAGGHDVAALLRAARRLHEILENDLEDDEDMGDYSTYNFSDFTHEYKTMVVNGNFQKKISKYIRENKDLFKGENDEDTSNTL